MRKAVILLATLSACQNTSAENEALIRQAKAAIGKEVGSPASAEFRNVRISADVSSDILPTVCGEVKAATDQIVDAPFRRFFYMGMKDMRAVEEAPNDKPATAEAKAFKKEFDEFWNEFCM